MKISWSSLGMYFLGNIVCTLLAIIFVEGWGIFGAIGTFVIIYFVITLLICRSFPKHWWIAAIIITSYLWSWLLHLGVNNIIELLFNPSLIDSKNFYTLLPLIGIISSIIGSYVGFRLSKSKEKLEQYKSK